MPNKKSRKSSQTQVRRPTAGRRAWSPGPGAAVEISSTFVDYLPYAGTADTKMNDTNSYSQGTCSLIKEMDTDKVQNTDMYRVCKVP